MCGDGANDAPALRQAQMGIAVSTATDVAKSAAGMVLTEPGLGGIVAAVREGRITFQRILSYTLNSVTKKTAQVLFLAIGLLMTGHAILTPLLMVLIMITGDFLGMALTTDNVRPSPAPNAWRIGNLTIAGVIMGLGELLFCTSVFAFGAYRVGLTIGALQTLAFVAIVFGVVGVAKVVEHGDGLDDAVDGLLAKGGNAGCHDRHSAGQVLSQLVIECANTCCSRVHVDSPLCLGENRRRSSSATPDREVRFGRLRLRCLGLPQKRRRLEVWCYFAAGLIRAMADRCRIMLGQPG
jgi:hypothetical protein